MKTMTKIVAMACVLSALTGLLAGYSIHGLKQITSQAGFLYERDLEGVDFANQIQTDILMLIRDERNMVIPHSREQLAKYADRLAKSRKELDSDYDKLKKSIYTEQGRAWQGRFETALAGWLETHQAIVRGAQAAESDDQRKALVAAVTEGADKADALLKNCEEILNLKREDAKTRAAAIAADSDDIALFALMATVCCVLAGLGLGFLIAKGIVGQLGDEPGSIAAIAQRIAAGDLAVRFDPSRPELGVFGAMKKMVEALKSEIAEAEEKGRLAQEEARKCQVIMGQAEAARQDAQAKAEDILQAAVSLEGVVEIATSASEELSAQVEQSSRGAEEQSRRVSEAATAMEQMNATVLEVAKNASQASDMSEKARRSALDGEKVVGEVVDIIVTIEGNARQSAQDMETLGKQADGIGRILNVISDIADQTNLLALNAAIEAARAGEAGRGFAVVADEVRKLAEKTMSATGEVGSAIQGIQDGAKKNLDNVDHAVKAISDAAGLAKKSGDSLKDIVGLVDRTSDQVRSIATASEQQSTASEEINRSMEQVATISTQTAQAMTQASQAVTDLARQTQVLQNLVFEMKAGGDHRLALTA